MTGPGFHHDVPRSELVDMARQLLQKYAPCRHSRDFRSVAWFGAKYSFTATQAAIVRELWEAWENDTPELAGETLLEAAGAETPRIDHVFQKHPAWQTLIVAGSTKGSYRLAEPETGKVTGDPTAT